MAAKTKKQKTTIDDLAIMVKNGFDEVNSKIDSVKTELGGVKAELKEFKETNRLEHEEIKLRLDNTAHRFEVSGVAKKSGCTGKASGGNAEKQIKLNRIALDTNFICIIMVLDQKIL